MLFLLSWCTLVWSINGWLRYGMRPVDLYRNINSSTAAPFLWICTKRRCRFVKLLALKKRLSTLLRLSNYNLRAKNSILQQSTWTEANAEAEKRRTSFDDLHWNKPGQQVTTLAIATHARPNTMLIAFTPEWNLVSYCVSSCVYFGVNVALREIIRLTKARRFLILLTKIPEIYENSLIFPWFFPDL